MSGSKPYALRLISYLETEQEAPHLFFIWPISWLEALVTRTIGRKPDKVGEVDGLRCVTWHFHFEKEALLVERFIWKLQSMVPSNHQIPDLAVEITPATYASPTDTFH